MKGDEETNANAESIKAAAEEKGIELSKEAINKAAVSKEATEALVSTFKAMKKVEAKIPAKFSQKVSLVGEDETEIDGQSDDPEAIRLAANELVKKGAQPTFLKAIEFLQKNKGE